MIKAIVCCAKDFGIGKANGLLFNIPADMAHFKEETTGKICVFGYNTYKSLSRQPLPKRVNVVLWDQAPSMDCLPGAITFSDFKQMINFVQVLAKQYDVYICGGAGVYAACLDYYDMIDITFVDAIDSEATAFFPDITKKFMSISEEIPHCTNSVRREEDTNGYTISRQIWVRKDV